MTDDKANKEEKANQDGKAKKEEKENQDGKVKKEEKANQDEKAKKDDIEAAASSSSPRSRSPSLRRNSWVAITSLIAKPKNPLKGNDDAKESNARNRQPTNNAKLANARDTIQNKLPAGNKQPKDPLNDVLDELENILYNNRSRVATPPKDVNVPTITIQGRERVVGTKGVKMSPSDRNLNIRSKAIVFNIMIRADVELRRHYMYRRTLRKVSTGIRRQAYGPSEARTRQDSYSCSNYNNHVTFCPLTAVDNEDTAPRLRKEPPTVTKREEVVADGVESPNRNEVVVPSPSACGSRAKNQTPAVSTGPELHSSEDSNSDVVTHNVSNTLVGSVMTNGARIVVTNIPS